MLGTLQFSGSYTQTTGANTLIDLGGTTQGVTYDLLKVGGLATLDGTLDVNLVNGFAPTVGETFNFLTYGSRSGSFDEILSFDPGFTYNVNYNDATGVGTLIVTGAMGVPEASTLFSAALMLVTGGLLLRRRRHGKQVQTA